MSTTHSREQLDREEPRIGQPLIEVDRHTALLTWFTPFLHEHVARDPRHGGVRDTCSKNGKLSGSAAGGAGADDLGALELGELGVGQAEEATEHVAVVLAEQRGRPGVQVLALRATRLAERAPNPG